jgi:hypothetical protein
MARFVFHAQTSCRVGRFEHASGSRLPGHPDELPSFIRELLRV